MDLIFLFCCITESNEITNWSVEQKQTRFFSFKFDLRTQQRKSQLKRSASSIVTEEPTDDKGDSLFRIFFSSHLKFDRLFVWLILFHWTTWVEKTREWNHFTSTTSFLTYILSDVVNDVNSVNAFVRRLHKLISLVFSLASLHQHFTQHLIVKSRFKVFIFTFLSLKFFRFYWSFGVYRPQLCFL